MWRLVSIGLCLAQGIPGQLSLRVESASRLSVRSSQCGVSGTIKYWASGRDLGKRFSLTADYQRYSTTYRSSYATTLQSNGLDLLQYAVDFTTKDTCGTAGPNDIILTVAYPRTRTVRFSIDSSSWGKPQLKLLSVDIDADGKLEYRATTSFYAWSGLIVIGPKPRKIRIRTHTTWTWHGGGVTTKFRFLRVPPCDVARYGTDCGKIKMGGPFPLGLDQMYLVQAVGRPNVVGALVAGTHKLSVPLPGTSACRLLTDPVVVHFYRTNVFGQAVLNLPIPAKSPSFANLQLLNVLDNNGRLDIEAAQAASILCR